MHDSSITILRSTWRVPGTRRVHDSRCRARFVTHDSSFDLTRPRNSEGSWQPLPCTILHPRFFVRLDVSQELGGFMTAAAVSSPAMMRPTMDLLITSIDMTTARSFCKHNFNVSIRQRSILTREIKSSADIFAIFLKHYLDNVKDMIAITVPENKELKERKRSKSLGRREITRKNSFLNPVWLRLALKFLSGWDIFRG